MTTKPLTLIHVDCGRTWGGGQAQVFMLLEGLRRAGHRNILVCREGCPLAQRASAEGVASVAKATFGTLTMHRMVGILNKIRHFEQADLLHLHDSRAHSIGALYAASVSDRIPIVVARRVAFGSRPTPLSRWKYRHGADHYIAISKAAAETVLVHGVSERKITVVPSCYAEEPRLALKGRQNLKARLGVSADTKILGAVGGLSKVKGHEVLLEAFEKVHKRREDVALLLAGEGPERGSLEELAKSLGISNRVFFMGFITEMGSIYADLDLFVLSSIAEGLNTSLLQAMAWEIPCVASNVGGVPEAISDGKDGLLVPPNDPSSLADAMLDLLNDPVKAHQLAVSAREKALRQFSKAQLVSSTEAVYRTLLERGQA